MILLIDNYDSFTFNLYQALAELGADVTVVRNDKITLDDLEARLPEIERVVISPGPCTPNEAGISVPLVRRLAGRRPILGVCLGHQAVGQVFGASVIRAPELMHGKTSWLRHTGVGVFAGLALLSHAWLARFRLGPLEWLWRCGTYGRWLPI